MKLLTPSGKDKIAKALLFLVDAGWEIKTARCRRYERDNVEIVALVKPSKTE